MNKITVATTGLLVGYITGRAFEIFRHDGTRSLHNQLIASFRTCDEIRQVLLDVQTARSPHPVFHVVDRATSFDNVTKLSRKDFMPKGGGDVV